MGLIQWLNRLDERVARRWPGPDRTLRLLSDELEDVRAAWRELPRSQRESHRQAALTGDITAVPAEYRMGLLRAAEEKVFRVMRIIGYILVAFFVPTVVVLGSGRPAVAVAFAMPGLALVVGQPFVWSKRLRDLGRRRERAMPANEFDTANHATPQQAGDADHA